MLISQIENNLSFLLCLQTSVCIPTIDVKDVRYVKIVNYMYTYVHIYMSIHMACATFLATKPPRFSTNLNALLRVDWKVARRPLDSPSPI
jgi:hypothetical protein